MACRLVGAKLLSEPMLEYCWLLIETFFFFIFLFRNIFLLWYFLRTCFNSLSRVTHTCAFKLTIIGSNNDLSPCRCQAGIWSNDRILLIGPFGTYFSEILIEIDAFPFRKMRLKVSFEKWRSFRLGLNVLKYLVALSQMIDGISRHFESEDHVRTFQEIVHDTVGFWSYTFQEN